MKRNTNNKKDDSLFNNCFILIMVCCIFALRNYKIATEDTLPPPVKNVIKEDTKKSLDNAPINNKVESNEFTLIELSETRKEFYKIINMIHNNLPYDRIVSEINSLELNTNKTIKELFDKGAVSASNYQIIISKIYEHNDYQKNFRKSFDKDFFEVNSEIINVKDAYFIEFQNEILTVENLTKNKIKQIDLSNFVQGVTTTERIQIYSQLQKLDGSLLEFLIDECGGLTSATGTPYGGWFMSYGVSTLSDYNAVAHEVGHAIDNHFVNQNAIHFSDELVTNEIYHNEILSMYKAGETDNYYHSLIGNYEYKSVPASEREVYAECVRTILDYSDEAHVKLYKQFLPNTLKYVANTMKDALLLTDEQRGSAIKKQALIVPKEGHLKAAKARLEQGKFNSLYVNNPEIFE